MINLKALNEVNMGPLEPSQITNPELEIVQSMLNYFENNSFQAGIIDKDYLEAAKLNYLMRLSPVSKEDEDYADQKFGIHHIVAVGETPKVEGLLEKFENPILGTYRDILGIGERFDYQPEQDVFGRENTTKPYSTIKQLLPINLKEEDILHSFSLRTRESESYGLTIFDQPTWIKFAPSFRIIEK